MEVLNKYKMQPGETGVYIGRPSPLGNPFQKGQHGDRGEVVALFKDYFLSKLAARDPEIEMAFRKLTLMSSCVGAPAFADSG